MRLIGILLMLGSAAFVYLYDTGKWPSVWAVLRGGPSSVQPGFYQMSFGYYPTGADSGAGTGTTSTDIWQILQQAYNAATSSSPQLNQSLGGSGQ